MGPCKPRLAFSRNPRRCCGKHGRSGPRTATECSRRRPGLHQIVAIVVLVKSLREPEARVERRRANEGAGPVPCLGKELGNRDDGIVKPEAIVADTMSRRNEARQDRCMRWE